MDPEKLLAGYKRVISTIYSPDKFFERCLTNLKMTPVENIGTRATGFNGNKSIF